MNRPDEGFFSVGGTFKLVFNNETRSGNFGRSVSGYRKTMLTTNLRALILPFDLIPVSGIKFIIGFPSTVTSTRMSSRELVVIVR